MPYEKIDKILWFLNTFSGSIFTYTADYWSTIRSLTERLSSDHALSACPPGCSCRGALQTDNQGCRGNSAIHIQFDRIARRAYPRSHRGAFGNTDHAGNFYLHHNGY